MAGSQWWEEEVAEGLRVSGEEGVRGFEPERHRVVAFFNLISGLLREVPAAFICSCICAVPRFLRYWASNAEHKQVSPLSL